MWDNSYEPATIRRWGSDYLPQKQTAEILKCKSLCRGRSADSQFCKQAIAISKQIEAKDFSAKDFEQIADTCVDAMTLFKLENVDDDYQTLKSLSSAIWEVGISASYCSTIMQIVDALEGYEDGIDSALLPLIQRVVAFFDQQILLHYSQSIKATYEIVLSCEALVMKLSQKKSLSPIDTVAIVSLNLLLAEISGEYLEPQSLLEENLDVEYLPEELRRRFNKVIEIVRLEHKRQVIERASVNCDSKSLDTLLRAIIVSVMEDELDTYRVSKVIDSLEKAVTKHSSCVNQIGNKNNLLLVTAISALEDNPRAIAHQIRMDPVNMREEIERILQEATYLSMSHDELDLMIVLLSMIAIRNVYEINELAGPNVALGFIGIIEELINRLSAWDNEKKLLSNREYSLIVSIMGDNTDQINEHLANKHDLVRKKQLS